ncbi:AmmeMemoRadiSam system protein B [Candidatus Sumerlaeota bacterium]|nr:AmmeMemoRadiSam system protein B [Candidatus Sumerlaeota bacterium]
MNNHDDTVTFRADDRPKARAIEMLPFEHEGEVLVMLRDPLMYVEEPMLLSPMAGIIATLMDGERTLEEIRGEIQQQFKIEVPLQDIATLAYELDQCHMMDTPRFAEHKATVEREYFEKDSRPAYLAGKSYPDDAGELMLLLQSFFQAEEGPGNLPPMDAEAVVPIRGVVAPHVDLHKGGPTFAHAYHRLAQSPPADLYIILGTGHAGPEELFAATVKNFSTPLGEVQTDADFVQRLNARLPYDLLLDEAMHRTEHVIEFQALFLQFILGQKQHPYKIVPLLCSYSPIMTNRDVIENFPDHIDAFAQALRETIAETKMSICTIASVDFSHMGPRYGDPRPLNTNELEELQQDDSQTLRIIASGDAAEFNRHVMSDDNNNRRRICGYPCIHTMLQSGDFSDGQILKYDLTQIDEAGSVVSFASMLFH